MSVKKDNESTVEIYQDKSPKPAKCSLFYAAKAGSQQTKIKLPFNSFSKPPNWMLFYAAKVGFQQSNNTLD